MKKTIAITFPGGKKVDLNIDKHTVHTDQPVMRGGEGTYPNPFQLFLGSLAGCVGYFALEFCYTRNISTEGLSMLMDCFYDEEKKRFTKIAIIVTLPDGFPKKYRNSIIRSIDSCSVKKHMLEPPSFEIIAQ
ncbi:OsmC family protein [Chlamydiota bacterium]